MTCPPCTHDCNQGETCPAKSKKAKSQLESQEPDVQETLHWYAFNYRQAHTAQAHEMWLELEKFVDRKMNTHSPQRTWVGLTDKVITKVVDSMPRGINGWMSDWDLYEYARAIEAKLKKNNGFAEEKNT
jgi:hypothetical protein